MVGQGFGDSTPRPTLPTEVAVDATPSATPTARAAASTAPAYPRTTAGPPAPAGQQSGLAQQLDGIALEDWIWEAACWVGARWGMGDGSHRAVGLGDNEHHADKRPAAQRAPPLGAGAAAPQGDGAGGADAAVAALEEDRAGPAVHAEVARAAGIRGHGAVLFGNGGLRAWRRDGCRVPRACLLR